MKGICMGLTLLLLTGCGKKEVAPESASSAAPAPPPAVSIAPIREPGPAMTASAAPSAAEAPAAAAVASAAPATPSTEEHAEPKKAVASGSIQACCASLQAAAKKGGRTKNQYSAAAATCAGLEKQLKAGKGNLAAVKVTMRAQLAGVPLPSGC